jgi:uncharacterized membrane protein
MKIFLLNLKSYDTTKVIPAQRRSSSTAMLPALLLLMLLLPCQVAVHAALLELPIALSHTALNTDFKILCRAAQVCRSWRDAVQQCTARNVAVELNTLSGRANLQGFSKWLCKHARLVSSITAAVGKWEPSRNAQLSELVDAEQWRNQFRAVEDLLLQALQLAANPTGTYVLSA